MSVLIRATKLFRRREGIFRAFLGVNAASLSAVMVPKSLNLQSEQGESSFAGGSGQILSALLQ